MATVQDKRDVTEEQLAVAETYEISSEGREKFVRFDDPHVTAEEHHHHDDGEPSMAEKIVMVNVVVIPLIAMLAVIAMSWSYGFMGWLYIGLLFGGWYVTGLGITVGFHRLFSHHSFQCTRSVKIFWAVVGALAVEGSPIKWCAVHRKHHQFSDHHGDPHSPHLHDGGLKNILKGFYHSHLGWLIYGKWTQKETQKYAPDLLKDPVLIWIHNNYVWVVTASLLIPAVIAGLVTMSLTGAMLGFLWGGLARVCFTHHMTWSINSICHIFGSQDYKSSDDSKNNFLFGFLSHGEGWHNNHHAFPTSARHGLKWWQFDLSWIIIRGMQAAGLVWKVRLPSEKALQKRALR
jgi:stearoyl-CoA desaturase (delta-9 desaturase)